MVQRKQVIRPGKGESKSATFSTRITPQLRKALDDAADSSGRSLSDEIEIRLWKSFDQDEEAEELRTQIDQERKKPGLQFGSDQNFAALRIVAEIMKGLRAATGKTWVNDPWTFDQLRKGIEHLLSEWRPDGDAARPTLRHYSSSTAENLGESLASHELARLDFENLVDPTEDRARKRDLGDLATRRRPRGIETYGVPDDD